MTIGESGFFQRIHETAEVEVGAIVSRTAIIWRHAHVSGGVRIGENCVIGEGVHIGPHVTIGNGCKIQNGAQLFEGVTLEDDVFIGPHVVFTNVLTPRAFIDRKAEFKPTLVRRGASIGANATIICGVAVGEYAMIGAGSVVTKNVEPHALVVGNPAKHTNWVCRCGVQIISDRRNNPAMTEGANGVVTCHACGTKLKLRFSPLYPYQIDVVGIINAEVP